MAKGGNVRRWLGDALVEVLGFDGGDDFVASFLNQSSEALLREHYGGLVGADTPRKQQVLEELVRRQRLGLARASPTTTVSAPADKLDQRRGGKQQQRSKACTKAESSTSTKKDKSNSHLNTSLDVLRISSPGTQQTKPLASSDTSSKTRDVKVANNDVGDVKSATVKDGAGDTSENLQQSSNKKKLRYVDINSAAAEAILKEKLGRSPCTCLAQRYPLINNCSVCGRIVCSNEGSGPCFTCGNLVVSAEDIKMMAKDSRKGRQIRQRYDEQSKAHEEALEKAMTQRNKMLEFDRTSARRTKVHDDQSDYFVTSSTSWLSPEDRAKNAKLEVAYQERKNTLRKKNVISLDIGGRRVVHEEVDESDEATRDAVVAELSEANAQPRQQAVWNPYDENDIRPVFVKPDLQQKEVPEHRLVAAQNKKKGARVRKMNFLEEYASQLTGDDDASLDGTNDRTDQEGA